MAKITELHKEIIVQIKESCDIDDDDIDDPSMQKLINAKVIAAAGATVAAAEAKTMALEFKALKESNVRLEHSGIERIVAGVHAIAVGIAAIAPDGQKEDLLELAKSFANRDSNVHVTTIGQSNQTGDGNAVIDKSGSE